MQVGHALADRELPAITASRASASAVPATVDGEHVRALEGRTIERGRGVAQVVVVNAHLGGREASLRKGVEEDLPRFLLFGSGFLFVRTAADEVLEYRLGDVTLPLELLANSAMQPALDFARSEQSEH